jgi:3-deoxy-D-manno-octulosonic-acid transferase
VKRFLARINPVVIVLVELEVWPNLLRVAERRTIPVVVVNGRLSDRSYNRYKKVSWFLRSTFGRLSIVGMQNEAYSKKVSSLGATNVEVLGTMKWDNAIIRDSVPEAKELAINLGINLEKPLIVAGSTTPEEHVLLLNSTPDDVQLLVAPRRPEWFDSAEEIFEPCNRRTKTLRKEARYFVLDTIGELTEAYSLATIVVIGRSFSNLHGSDPTEAIGLGKPTIIGPNVSDFSDIVNAFLEGDGMIQCTEATLKKNIEKLLADAGARESLAENGRKIIASHQGATQRYVKLIEEVMP